MKLLNIGRRQGKTTACLKWLNENRNGHIVTYDAYERDRLIVQMNTLYGETVAYWADRIHNYNALSFRGRTGPVVVDNIELILKQVYGFEVVGITGTFEDW